MRTEFCAISLLRFNQLRNFSLMRVTGNFRGANRETYRDYRETENSNACELCVNLGDDGGMKAAYRGGCRACQTPALRALAHPRLESRRVPSSPRASALGFWKAIEQVFPSTRTIFSITSRRTRSRPCFTRHSRIMNATSHEAFRFALFKLVDAAAKTWRRLKGENQLPKVIAGIKFQNGIEVVKMPAYHAA